MACSTLSMESFSGSREPHRHLQSIKMKSYPVALSPQLPCPQCEWSSSVPLDRGTTRFSEMILVVTILGFTHPCHKHSLPSLWQGSSYRQYTKERVWLCPDFSGKVKPWVGFGLQERQGLTAALHRLIRTHCKTEPNRTVKS